MSSAPKKRMLAYLSKIATRGNAIILPNIPPALLVEAMSIIPSPEIRKIIELMVLVVPTSGKLDLIKDIPNSPNKTGISMYPTPNNL